MAGVRGEDEGWHTSPVDFSDALKAVKDGKRVRRALWSARSGYLDGYAGLVAELVQPPQLPDGRPFMPLIVIEGEDGILRPAVTQYDVLADDWELAD